MATLVQYNITDGLWQLNNGSCDGIQGNFKFKINNFRAFILFYYFQQSIIYIVRVYYYLRVYVCENLRALFEFISHRQGCKGWEHPYYTGISLYLERGTGIPVTEVPANAVTYM